MLTARPQEREREGDHGNNNSVGHNKYAKSVRKTTALETAISDHKIVHSSVYIRQKRQPPKVITARTYKHMRIGADFRKDLTNAP